MEFLIPKDPENGILTQISLFPQYFDDILKINSIKWETDENLIKCPHSKVYEYLLPYNSLVLENDLRGIFDAGKLNRKNNSLIV